VETLLDGGAFFEGPRWRDGRWWVSDFFRQVVLTVDPRGRASEVVRVEGRPSGLGWLPDGSLLVVSMRDRCVLQRSPSGALRLYADLSAHCDWHANDMVVAADGSAYVGNFGFDLAGGAEPRPTALVRVDLDRTVTPAADRLLFPNGSVITPDGRTLVVGETFGRRLTAFTIAGDGSLSDRRVWADLRAAGIAPDGCCLDAEGRIWVADGAGHRCCLVAEGGELVREIPSPRGLRFYACMLGGDDGRRLLLCAAPDYDERRRRSADTRRCGRAVVKTSETLNGVTARADGACATILLLRAGSQQRRRKSERTRQPRLLGRR
jgi:sugar lactone lactonase YvrE